jgi:hypothetical protein
MELDGREFDWFAIDRDGRLALFSTAGEGVVPPAVHARYSEHDSVSETIAAPRTGTADVWQDYADAGLYVFDWDHRASYRKLANPTRDMTVALQSGILALASLVRMRCSFVEIVELRARDI